MFLPLIKPLLYGGLLGEELWRGCLALVVTLFHALALGIWVSAGRKDEVHLLKTASWKAAALILGPFVGQFVFGRWVFTTLSALSSATAVRAAFDKVYQISPTQYWGSVTAAGMVGFFMLVRAAVRLQRTWAQETSQASHNGRGTGTAPRRVGSAGHPMVWLASRHIGRSFGAKLFGVLVPGIGLGASFMGTDFLLQLLQHLAARLLFLASLYASDA